MIRKTSVNASGIRFVSSMLIQIAIEHGISIETLRNVKHGGAGYRNIVSARRKAAQLLRSRGWSYPAIQRVLGYRSHTSVIDLLGGRAA